MNSWRPAHLDRARHPVRKCVATGLDQRRIGRRIAQRTLQRAVLVDDQDIRRLSARPGLRGAERRRRRVGGQRRHDGPPVAAALAGLAGGDHGGLGHARRDQHIDGAAAREADVPRLLVADPIADDPFAAGLARRPDLLGRRPFDATAGHRAREPAVVGDQQDRALGPRCGAERPHDHGAADAGAFSAPAVERVQQFLHRGLRFVGSASADHVNGLACPASTASASMGRGGGGVRGEQPE